MTTMLATNSKSGKIREQFEQNGFVGPLDIISKSEAQRILNEVTNELSDNPTNSNPHRFKLHLIIPSLSKLAHHPILVNAVQEALGSSNILLWSSDINIKLPNAKGYFAPHQDSTYAGLIPPSKCLTAWIALSDPVGPNEGCLSFYSQPLSQLKQLPHETRNSTSKGNNDNDNGNNNNNNMLSLGQYISTDCLLKQNCLSSNSIKQIPLRGGQATLHSFFSVHYSGPNTTTNHSSRIGFALRYIVGNDEVKQTKPIKEMVTWISSSSKGDDDDNNDYNYKKRPPVIHNFDLEPKLLSSSSSSNPTKEELQKGYQARKEAMRREEANYFANNDN